MVAITAELVPDWLCGTWTRDYIRRAAGNNHNLGPLDSTVHVRYVQTPWAFVDVRRAPGTMEGVMAFAGMTTVELGDLPLVRWHACLDLTGPFEDASERWAQADGGSPRATDDEGYFEKLEDNVYRETDPAKTYEEQWVRTSDGEHRFLGAGRGTALLVVAGETFGFATQTTEDMTATFVAGLTSEWMIEISAANPNLEGSSLVLPGVLSEWTILPGSTLELDALKPNFQKVTSTSDE